jgi:hypothetical protein
MKQFVDDHYPLVFALICIVAIITIVTVAIYFDDKKYTTCIEAKMQYISGSCVNGKVETK